MQKIIFVTFLLVGISCFTSANAQVEIKSVFQELPDTLQRKLNLINTPTERYDYLFNVLSNHSKTLLPPLTLNIERAILRQMLYESSLLTGRLRTAEAHERLGLFLEKEGHIGEAIIQWQEALKRWNLLNNRNREGVAILKIVHLELELKNYNYALDLCYTCIKTYTKIKYKDGIAKVRLQLADIYFLLNKSRQAEEQINEVIAGRALLLDKKNLAEAYYRKAKLFNDFGDKEAQNNKLTLDGDSVLFFLQKAEELWLQNRDTTASLKAQIATANRLKLYGEKEKVITLYNDVLNKYLRENNKLEACKIALELADYRLVFKYYPLSVENANQALLLAHLIHNRPLIAKAYWLIYANANAQNQSTLAYQYLKLFTNLQDSLIIEQNTRQSTALRNRYQTDKKNKEIELSRVDNLLLTARNEEQRLIRNSLFGGSFVAFALAFALWQRYRFNKKENGALKSQNEAINEKNIALSETHLKVNKMLQEVEQQKLEIQEKNENIEEGVRYAFKIQSAILPETEKIKKSFTEFFIFYRPLHIVSGDFYWFDKKKDIAYFAAIDCTGHGVPGAFMSIVGYTTLNQIINQNQEIQPHTILMELDRRVRLALHQNDANQSKDGMDIALISWNAKTKELCYAGAGRPLYHIHKGGLQEYKADKFPVGGAQHKHKEFTLHQIKATKGDRFYFFSDGVTDQFGGHNKRKFTTTKLQEFIVSHQEYNMAKQQVLFTDIFDSWQGKLKQLDDVLFIGFEIP